MFTGKILTTMVAITTAVILLSQLNASSEIIPDIYEPYVNYALRPVQETSCEKDCRSTKRRRGGKKLTGLFPDSVFVSSKQLDPITVMGMGTKFSANALAGLNMQASINKQSIVNTDTAFANFEAASGVVDALENYEHKSKKGCGCGASPCGCASGNNGYGQQDTLPADYSPFDATGMTLPISGMTAYEVPAAPEDRMDAQGEIQSVICRSRLMYSTQQRYGSHVGDRIRGDIAVSGCQTVSKTAARAADSLHAGAFAVMNGINAKTPQHTAAAIAADTGAAISTLGGVDLSEAVATSAIAPVLTNATFLSNSAKLYLDQTNGTPDISTGVSTAFGEVVAQSGRTPIVITGYTGF